MHGRLQQAVLDFGDEIFGGVGDARARSAQRERRANETRKANVIRYRLRFFDRVRDARSGYRQPGGDHRVFELQAIFGQIDRGDLRADQLHVVFIENARAHQIQRQIQRGLPAHGRQDRIGLLGGDDLLDDVGRQRLDVGRIGEFGIGHDRRRIGIDEDDAIALAAQAPCTPARRNSRTRTPAR